MSNKSVMVLTRKYGEAIKLSTPAGEIIEFAIVQIKGRQVRVAVKCDRNIKVDRIENMSPKEVALECQNNKALEEP